MRTTACLALLALALVAPAGASAYEAEVKRTEHGIPHITAAGYGSLAYGYARALAEDNLCVVAETYVTVNGERSRFFGPDARYAIRGNGSTAKNINSDVFYTAIKDEGRVERLVAQRPPLGPRRQLKQGVRGFVAGWNDHLREIGGAAGVSDPACKGEPWVREIDEWDVYRSFYRLSLLASGGVAIDGIAEAQPPVGGQPSGASRRAIAPQDLEPGVVDERLGGLGSNALALGRDATRSGDGLLYGNPHFPWEGSERFYQSHLRIPGKLNVAGGSLLGVPLVLIGHTDGMAWSHTVSTARRFTPFELRLVPGSPTTYLHDGQPRQMTKRVVEVRVQGEDEPRRRTLWSSHHGPILTSILGLPIFPWTPERAFALGDVNAENFGRLLNHFFDVNHAQSVPQVERILERYLGIPWVNTLVADRRGRAFYGDIGAIPHVTDEKLQTCRTAVGIALDTAARLPVLDGSRSSCEWGSDPDAIVPGVLGPRRLPSMQRSDYVSNMNDSYWLTNPRQPIEGFDRIIGEERTVRSLRTRGGLWMVEQRLARPVAERYTLDNVRAEAMSNGVPAGELWQDELVAMCRQLPVAPSSSGPVSTAGACEALAGWDRRDDLDSAGAVLFRRFAVRALGAAGGPYSVPFDASDPVDTPRGLNSAHPQVRQALGDAINDLKGAGIPLDAGLRGWQYELRGEEPIPVHGGPHSTGVFNVITARWSSRSGYSDVNHGSSFVQAVELPRKGCPRARTILTYSQSTDSTSPYYADQNRLYARKGWVAPPFCAEALAAAPGATRTYASGP